MPELEIGLNVGSGHERTHGVFRVYWRIALRAQKTTNRDSQVQAFFQWMQNSLKRSFEVVDPMSKSPDAKRHREIPDDLAIRLASYAAIDAEALKRRVDDLVGYGVGYETPAAYQHIGYLYQTVGQMFETLQLYLQPQPVTVPVHHPPPLQPSPGTPVMMPRPDVAVQAPARVDGKPESNLYVSGLPMDATEAFLLKLFSPFGPVKSVRLYDGLEARGKYGFCRMVNYQDAVAAVQALHRTPFENSPTGTLLVAFKRTSDRDVAKLTKAS